MAKRNQTLNRVTMKKRKSSRIEHDPEDRKRSINFKKKKQRFEENYFKPNRLIDLDKLEDESYEQ